MIVPPEEWEAHLRTVVQRLRACLDASADELAERGRSNWHVEVRGEYRDTEILVRYDDARFGEIVASYPLWYHDLSFPPEGGVDPPEFAATVISINTTEPGLPIRMRKGPGVPPPRED